MYLLKIINPTQYMLANAFLLLLSYQFIYAVGTSSTGVSTLVSGIK